MKNNILGYDCKNLISLKYLYNIFNLFCKLLKQISSLFGYYAFIDRYIQKFQIQFQLWYLSTRAAPYILGIKTKSKYWVAKLKFSVRLLLIFSILLNICLYFMYEYTTGFFLHVAFSTINTECFFHRSQVVLN